MSEPMEEARDEMEKTTPPPETPPVADRPTYEMDPRTGKTERVA